MMGQDGRRFAEKWGGGRGQMRLERGAQSALLRSLGVTFDQWGGMEASFKWGGKPVSLGFLENPSWLQRGGGGHDRGGQRRSSRAGAGEQRAALGEFKRCIPRTPQQPAGGCGVSHLAHAALTKSTDWAA